MEFLMRCKMDINNQTYHVFLSKIKWPLLITAITFLIGLIGYLFIIYGGSLVVDDERLILDQTTTIETGEGEIIGELYHEKRTLITIDNIPEHVQQAFVAIEDSRFYKHSGVDIKSVARAIYKDIIARSKVEGASTITQQLAKNLFLYNDKTWMRKTKEVMAALYLERKFSKDELLEFYLNTIYFGDGIYGIEAASDYFFSKSAKELTVSEGALLAGLAKGPNGYSPIKHPEKSLTRRNLVLKVMNQQGMISTEEQLEAQGKTLGLKVHEYRFEPWFDSYIDLVMKEAAQIHHISLNELKRGGYRIVVNIDPKVQQIAYEQFKKDTYFPSQTEDVEGSFVMMEQASGKVVAALGGRDYKLGDINRVTVKRQPGSTMKPLAVYGPAMMEGFDVYSVIPDEVQDYGGYVPKNIDGQYEGSVSIYDALAKSKNTSAVWLLNEIGVNYAKDFLSKMDMEIPDQGLAIALGGLSEGLTPLNMVKGYRAFAHEGKIIDPYTIEQIYNNDNELIAQAKLNETEVFNPQVAWNMTEILTHAVDIGHYHEGGYAKALAGKTGTTGHPHVKSMTKDAWFVGYTPEYVSALWIGFDRSDEEHYLTGGSAYPAGLTEHILNEVDRYKDLAATFTKPDHVKAVPKPIELPIVQNVEVKFVFGGIPLVKGKLMWSGSEDERVVYHVYKSEQGRSVRIGEVTGKTEYIIDDVSLLKTDHYYVVPYNPLTQLEGEKSVEVELKF